MRTSENRAAFAAALADLRALKLGYESHRMHVLLRAYFDELSRELKKRKNPKAALWSPMEMSIEIGKLQKALERKDAAKEKQMRDLYHPRFEAVADAEYEEHKRIKKRLDALADVAELRPADESGEWLPLALRTTYDYSTQGLGALSYAEGAVEAIADVARYNGFVDGKNLVVLRVREHTDGVLAAVRVEDRLDVEILKRSTPPPLREQVRMCWARGVNPRVFLPLLPHGYEESVGIDYFGRDLRKAGVPA